MAGKVKLTKADVLAAVDRAVAPWSNYIGDQVHRAHQEAIAAGGVGYAPTVGLISRRLNALAADGLLTKSAFTQGYYGYLWTITPAGRAALSQQTGSGGRGNE